MERKTTQRTHTKSILRIFIVTALILLVPFVAMQFTNDVDWSAADFIIIGSLLVGAGLVFEFGVRNVKNSQHQIILAFLLVLALLLVWAELAVGVFGSPFAGS